MKIFPLVNNPNNPKMKSTVSDRARTMWCMRLHSALRAAAACAIVGGATVYGPEFVRKNVKFVAFSYLTTVLIVCDATLGDTLKGCWHAFCATVQVVPVAMLARWAVEPMAGLPVGLAALAVVAAGFLVAVPESTHLTAKRIAFGQIVLVCTDAVVGSDGTGPGFMHPLHVAASTGLGALASVLALLLPFPGLARRKVERLCQVYAENASERMNLYLGAFSSQDNQTKTQLISEAKPVGETGSKLLQSLRTFEEGMNWERIRCSNRDSMSPGDKLQSLELPMRGIEYSLASSPPILFQMEYQEQLSNILQGVSTQIHRKIEQVRCTPPSKSMIEPETGREDKEEEALLPLEQIFPTNKHDWVFFFFSCIDILLNHMGHTRMIPKEEEKNKQEFSIIRTLKNWFLRFKSSGRLEFAFKCSVSLGLAVLFGLIFDKENGCWAGLTIAISFVTGRQAVFTVANTRAQGTAIGSVYGVICCFLFHHEELRLVALLPWIVFTCFLRHSRMYGQTGGVSAAIGALLILGRKHYGDPDEFAIARLTEVFIGLSCFIVVELSLQPTRASTLAKNHMYLTLRALQDCLKQRDHFCGAQNNQAVPKILELRQKQRHLDSLVRELRKFVEDADSEPDFWFLPFQTCCYQKLVRYLSNIVDMVYFIIYNLETHSEIPENCNVMKEFEEHVNSEFEQFQETLHSLLKYMEKAESNKTRTAGEESMDDGFRDLEEGKLQIPEKIINGQIADNDKVSITGNDGAEKQQLRGRTVRCLSAMRFCLSSLRKEIDEMEICTKEIARWEGHSSQ